MSIKGTQLALSLAKRPELGTVTADQWVVDCKRNLIIQPSTGKARALPMGGILLESISGFISVNERRFRDQLVIYPSPVKECMVVNHLEIERYLESVVNAEFNSQWAESAVQAQIIAARTYALFQMREARKSVAARKKLFDVESTQKDQVYLGMDNADSKGAKLVALTRGLILTDGKTGVPSPIKAFYHASCGGHTVLPQEVWGSRFSGFQKGVTCPFCVHAPSYQWDYQISFNEIQQRIQKGIQSDSVGRKSWPKEFLQNPRKWILMDVKQSVEKNERISNMIFEFVDRDELTKPLKVKMNAYQARNWFDPAKMKSTLFQLVEKGRSIIFKGKGSGHGVGMCQWGAKNMGERGYTREKILSFYYPGVKIARVW